MTHFGLPEQFQGNFGHCKQDFINKCPLLFVFSLVENFDEVKWSKNATIWMFLLLLDFIYSFSFYKMLAKLLDCSFFLRLALSERKNAVNVWLNSTIQGSAVTD